MAFLNGELLVQWTTNKALGWRRVLAKNWLNLPKRPVPLSGEVGGKDDLPGHVFNLCYQGMTFSADHYAVEHLGDGVIRITVWNDDEEDWEPGYKYARQWTIHPLTPDPNRGMAYNTRQEQVIFAEDRFREDREIPLQNTIWKPWSEFVLPDEKLVRHGIWVPDSQDEDLRKTRKIPSWRHWTQGVPPELVLPNGVLKDQRRKGLWKRPEGTQTWYQIDTTRATGVHSIVNEYALEKTPPLGTPTEITEVLAKQTDEETHVFTTPAGEPGEATWPTGNYRADLDATTGDADLHFGLAQTAGASGGHFGRVNSTLTAPHIDTQTQQETLFTGTGIKSATTGSVMWGGSTASDRLEICVAADNQAHQEKTLGLTVDETDDFVDGPWPSDAVTGNMAPQVGASAGA